MTHGKWFTVWVVMLLGGMWACVDEEYDSGIPAGGGEAGTIGFVSDPMRAYRVTSRASDAKDDDEKRINYLHIFFFDEEGEYLTGSYLTGYPDATAAEGGYYAAGEGVTVLKIANESEHFTDVGKAQRATVYAVANVDDAYFRELDENGRPQVVTALAEAAGISPREALERLTYAPEEGVSLGLPRAGMPMAGSKQIDLTKAEATEEGERIVELKALMARVDVNISLASEVSEGNLPAMTLVEWKAKNLPTRARIGEPPADSTTGTGWTDWGTEGNPKDITTPLQRTIYNRNGEISFSFYMFENRQKKRTDYTYPSEAYNPELGIDKRQNYKPWMGADTANSAAVELHAFYSTYNDDGSGSATYEVWYTLYLGANHTDNFEVKRNHQYKNDITITGLTAQAAIEGGKYTFDARVNIDEEANDFYIAMLRERNHDAHFCVTPMDVYLFADASKQPTVEVILGEVPDGSEVPTAGTVPDWIRMEKIPAADMQAGTVADESKQLIAGANFTAGHGKRKWFTTSLLGELSSKVTIDESRDRVYFYLDENIDKNPDGSLKMEDRTATVTLIYKELNSTTGQVEEVRRRTVEIGQTHLLPVYVYNRDDDGNKTTLNQVIYMEQYEEYLDHYDPLDEYQNEQIYTGLSWANEGTPLADYEIPLLYEGVLNAFEDPRENYYDGCNYTSFVVNYLDEDQATMTLNEKPMSAFQYCHNKNKRRDSDGKVPASYHTLGGGWLPITYYEDSNNSKWFLPGIRQMEDALTQYYTTFPEFQGDYYWSSSAAKRGITGGAQDEDRARATSIDEDGNYAESNESQSSFYPNGGNAERTEELRIRAFRVDLEPLNY